MLTRNHRCSIDPNKNPLRSAIRNDPNILQVLPRYIVNSSDNWKLRSLNFCSNELHDYTFGKKLGEGSFGIVYKGTAITNNREIPIAIKIIQAEYETPSQIDEMIDEIEYSYWMGEVGIGPVVYESFYIIAPSEDGKVIFNQFIIMEPMDTDVLGALRKRNVKPSTKYAIMEKVVELILLQTYEFNMLCSDLKPANFVVSLNPVKVLMIDFGADFCTFNPNANLHEKNIHALFQLLQMVILIYTEFPKDYYLLDHFIRAVSKNGQQLFSPQLLEEIRYRLKISPQFMQFWNYVFGPIYKIFYGTLPLGTDIEQKVLEAYETGQIDKYIGKIFDIIRELDAKLSVLEPEYLDDTFKSKKISGTRAPLFLPRRRFSRKKTRTYKRTKRLKSKVPK